MNQNDIDKYYVSPYDKFLLEFDAEHKKSASQLKEIKKFTRIFALRDQSEQSLLEKENWEGF